jgi:hypothetical protein
MPQSQTVTAYRFDDFVPKTGSTVHCWSSLEEMEKFARIQGPDFDIVRFWQIKGQLVRDEGGPDGWVVKVDSVKQIFLSLY